jgi:hypothetical protein
MQETLIIWTSGFGGEFIRRMLSLDLSTVPLLKHGPDWEDSVGNRLDGYSFYNSKKYEFYGQFHEVDLCDVAAYYDPDTRVKYDHFIIKAHPADFYDFFVDSNGKLLNPDIRIYTLTLNESAFNSFWISETIKFIQPILTVKQQEYQLNLKIINDKTFNVKPIPMEPFLQDQDSWIGFYSDLMNELGIPLHIDAAISLWQSWYNIRVKPIKEKFQKLTLDQVNNIPRIENVITDTSPRPINDYSTKLLETNNEAVANSVQQRKELSKKFGPVLGHWQNTSPQGITKNMIGIYNALKSTADWPGCSTLDDLRALPTWIKEEISSKSDQIKNIL